MTCCVPMCALVSHPYSIYTINISVNGMNMIRSKPLEWRTRQKKKQLDPRVISSFFFRYNQLCNSEKGYKAEQPKAIKVILVIRTQNWTPVDCVHFTVGRLPVVSRQFWHAHRMWSQCQSANGLIWHVMHLPIHMHFNDLFLQYS